MPEHPQPTNGTVKELIGYVRDDLRDFRRDMGDRIDLLAGRVDSLERARDRNYWPRWALTVATSAAIASGVGLIVGRGL